MIFTLKVGTTIAEFDNRGGFLTRLIATGRDLIYPVKNLTSCDGQIKRRGGMHVCLPNFGPDFSGNLAQHGFGRDQEWQLLNQSDDSISFLLNGGNDEYRHLSSQLNYKLSKSGLLSELIVTNRGRENLLLAPGFHPYFKTDGQELSVVINDGDRIDFDDAEATIFVDNIKQFQLNKIKVNYSVQGLPKFAVWTDNLGDYICLEPTEIGNGFLENTATGLKPNVTKKYSFRINWIFRQ